jgi:hypothetical protein
MKEMIILFAAFFSLAFASAQVTSGDIIGEWYGEEQDESYFEVTRERNGMYRAVVTASVEPENIGKVVFDDVLYDPDSKTWKGTLTPPGRSTSVDAEFTLVGEKQLQIDGKLAFISKTFLWERSL